MDEPEDAPRAECLKAAAGDRTATSSDGFGADLNEVFTAELRERLLGVPAQLHLLASRGTREVACHQLSRVFHTIKGSAGLVGRTDLVDAAVHLERFFAAANLLDDAAIAAAQACFDALFGAAEVEAPSLAAACAGTGTGQLALADQRELIEAFALEASEALDRCEELSLRLERNSDDAEVRPALLRQLHSLKGAAAALGLDAVAARLHEGESLLEAGGVDRGIGGSRLADRLLALVDSVGDLVSDAIGTDVHLPRAVDGASTRFARLPMAVLDTLMEQVGQLVVNRVQMTQKVRLFSELREKLHACRRRLAETAEGFDRRVEERLWRGSAAPAEVRDNGALPVVEGDSDELFSELDFDKYDDSAVLSRSVLEMASDAGEIADELGRLVETLAEQARQFAKITATLQQQISDLRRVPLATVFHRLERSVRDAARQAGKLVRTEFRGGDLQLDRSFVEALFVPLLHLVRNAVAHGIELPAVREARGKSASGTIGVSAALQPDGIVVTVEDDGAGIDLEAVRARARDLGLPEPVSELGRDELIHLIFRAGFTTDASPTELAGRGIGLDVVAQQVEGLNGHIEVSTGLGQGTTIALRLPLSTSIDEALMVEVGAQAFAIPVRFIEQTLPIEMSALREDGSRQILLVSGDRLPVIVLGALVGEPAPADTAVAVVLRRRAGAVALVVDRVCAQQEIAVRPLDRLLGAHPYLAGTTISAAGTVIFVLHVTRLLEVALTGTPFRAPLPLESEEFVDRSEPANAVLVVDDSLSVRKLMTRFLENEGFDVETAADGIDALGKLANGRFRLVITDLEMPRMHGYELMAEMKRHPRWRELPIIVCTSRTSHKHRRRAQELGAAGYITKPFTQEGLITEVRRVDPGRSLPRLEVVADDPPAGLPLAEDDSQARWAPRRRAVTIPGVQPDIDE